MRIRLLLSIVALSLALCACGSKEYNGNITCDSISISPLVSLLSPEQSTTISDSANTLVYDASSTSPVPIAIETSSATPSLAAPTLAPTSVPSPFPSPAATPQNYQMPYAVSLPALRPGTSYTVFARVHQGGCFGNFDLFQSIGSFTTQ